MPRKWKNIRFGTKVSNASRIAIKIKRNDKCPCNKTIDKIYIDEFGNEQIIPTPVKYKNCCINKQLFFLSEKDLERAKKLDKRGY